MKRSRSGEISLAAVYGLICHSVFVLGVGAMVVSMFFGMSRSLGSLPEPWSIVANAALLLQFVVLHSVLLTAWGRRALARLAPADLGRDLASTTYATIAAAQALALFALWTPSGVVWWRADGAFFWILTAAYAGSWALLMKSMLDAGIALQSGLLGWWSVLRGVRPVYPDMPTTGLFRIVRQPIYAAFALTLWTTPVWTPDQLAVAVTLTLYCLVGPIFKERRFKRFFGQRFETYRARTPYWIPRLSRRGR